MIHHDLYHCNSFLKVISIYHCLQWISPTCFFLADTTSTTTGVCQGKSLRSWWLIFSRCSCSWWSWWWEWGSSPGGLWDVKHDDKEGLWHDHEPCCDNCFDNYTDSIPFSASQWQSSGWPACQEIDAENGQVHRNIFSSLTCLWSQWTFNLIRDGEGELSEQEFVDGAVEQVVQIQMQEQEYIELDGAMKYARENIQRKYSSTPRVTQRSGENLLPGWAPGQTGEDCEKGRGTSLPDV